jgi:serine/threonine protein phosphatase 1
MLYAIGDIHGQAKLLSLLYDAIREDIKKHGDSDNKIIFLGDYIDRGPNNVQVLDFIKNLEDDEEVEHIFLRGNHEDIFTEAMEHPRSEFARKMWVNNGGQAFLDETKMDFSYFVETFPWHHYVNWFKRRLEPYYETEDYVFVHGGLDIRKPDLKKQDEASMRWARFMEHDHYANFHKMVIHGHTPRPDPVVDNNRVNVDTSWSYMKYPDTLVLTAVVLPNRRDDQPPRFIQMYKRMQAINVPKPE